MCGLVGCPQLGLNADINTGRGKMFLDTLSTTPFFGKLNNRWKGLGQRGCYFFQFCLYKTYEVCSKHSGDLESSKRQSSE